MMSFIIFFAESQKPNDDGHIKTSSKKISHHQLNLITHINTTPATTKTTFCDDN